MLETKVERQYLVYEILEWKRKRNALILAHNYELPEIQDIADVLGDSLALARAAMRADADVIVLCGVHFMPRRQPSSTRTRRCCCLIRTRAARWRIPSRRMNSGRGKPPGAVVVSYVNTSAEVKAESDYCCTSSNAVQVVRSIPEDREILFLPDMFLGSYVKRVTGRENLHIWMGECHVHAGIRPHDIEETLSAHPDAELLIHPECGCSTSNMYLLAEGQLPADRTHVLSTSGMLQRARESDKRAFIVATEVGILYQMERQNPDKTFIPANRAAVCPFMKMITLEKVRDALARLETVISVPADVADRARVAIERMVAIG